MFTSSDEKRWGSSGIQLKLAKTYFINHMREFLSKVEKRETFHCSNEFTYTPDVHSFKQETDAIIQQLIKIYHNEKCMKMH